LEALNGDEIGYPAPPSEVEKLEQVERLPQFLALFLVTLGVVAVGHALVVTVRRRRRDFGVLRAVGFRARDVRVAVSWQAIVIAVLGCLIGLPVGVLLARSVWGAVAQSIGVRTVLELPAAALLGVLPLTVLMAILVSLVPARRAAKLAPTQLLRSE
ncbi:MAG: ABC transporter permease, partial [Acidimicrobiia bacterium]